MNRPDYLKAGDAVAIAAPSRWVTREEIDPFLNIISGWGLNYTLTDNLFTRDHQLAGDSSLRIMEFITLLKNPEVKAIFCARGGYGAVHLLEVLSGQLPAIPPKWIVGFSDITILHFFCQEKLGCQSLHASMPYQSGTANGIHPASLESMRKALFGEPLQNVCAGHALNKPGKASGTLIGGNLSVIYSLTGTGYIPEVDQPVLFLEDVDEYLYHIDRMMYNLKLTGLLGRLKGLVIGYMNRMHDNEIPFGKDAYRIIHDVVSEYNFPLCLGFPAGHEEPNLALIMGSKVELEVTDHDCKLTFNYRRL